MHDDESPLAGRNGGQEEVDDDAGEDMPDWTQLAKMSRLSRKSQDGEATVAFIPKRGDKDFEPDANDALRAAQQHDVLTASRAALFSALSAGQRGHNSRDHVRCIWHPSLGRAHVDGVAKGILFSTIGFWSKARERLELFPEEALYLFERGTVEVWSEKTETQASVPMTVQWAWAEMIGSDNLTLERYQVFAYLRRLGYAALRKSHVDRVHASQRRAPLNSSPLAPTSFMQHVTDLHLLPARYLFSSLMHPLSFVRRVLARLPLLGSSARRIAASRRGEKALVGKRYWSSYDAIFRALRIVPSGPIDRKPPPSHEPTGGKYDIFWYVYKPNHHFPKTAPPPPDFQIAVVNAHSAPLPNLAELTDVLDVAYSAPYSQSNDLTAPPAPRPNRPSPPPPSRIRAFLPAFLGGTGTATTQGRGGGGLGGVYGKLKTGRRHVVLAMADDGLVTFLRFAETDFSAVPVSTGK